MKKNLLFVLGLCISMLTTAQNFSDVSESVSNNDSPGTLTTAKAILVSQTGLMASTLVTDRPTFQAACVIPTLMLEDFAGGPGAGTIATCANTIDSSGDGCFPAGELLPGFQVTRSGGAGVVYVGVGWGGHVYTEPYVGSNTFTQFTIINLTAPINQVGFDLISLRGGAGNGNNGGNIDVRVFGNAGLIDTYTITLTGDASSFVGIVADEAITRIELQDPTGQDVELIANLEFGDCGLPMISCPMDVTTTASPGVCGAVVAFPTPLATDDEDDPDPIPVQTAGLPSGSLFPVGINTVEFTVTDSDGLTATCSFTITVTDDEAPAAVCMDVTVQLDANGEYVLTAAEIDGGSTDNCGIASLEIGGNPSVTLDCSNAGDNTITLTVTDDAGNVSTCDATVTVEDVTAPEIFCIGEPAIFSYTQDFEGSTLPGDWSTEIVSGGFDWMFGSGTMPIGDSFPTNAAIFDDDALGSGELDNTVRLISPVFDLDGAIVANLSFDYAMQDFAGSGSLSVEVWDGAAWQEILFVTEDTNPTNSGVMDMLGFANDSFQVRYTYDDDDDWAWGAGVDTFVFDYEFPPSAPLSVELDANGMATINSSDLIMSVNEACGWTATVPGTDLDCADDISNGSNAFENGYFTNPSAGFIVANDIVVPADEDLELGKVTMNLFHDVGETIATVDFVYYDDNAGEPGAEIGSESGVMPDSQAVVGNNFGFDVSETVFTVTPFMFAGQAGVPTNYWVSVSVTSTSGGTTAWEVSSASGAGDYDALSFDGATWNNPGAGSDGVYVFEFNCVPEAIEVIDLDCSHLGLNEFEVTVTDDSGNTATCTATVEVLDVTAPILVCQDVTIGVGPDGTTEIDPEILLANMPSSYEVIAISSNNGSGTEGFTDFTVDVTADETVSFDWEYSTDDGPAWDRFGYTVNGTFTELSDENGANNQSGSATVPLVAGDVFGFRAQSEDGNFGAATTVVSNFAPGFEGQFDTANWTLTLDNSDGDAFFVEIPGGPLSFDACGITVLAVDVTEVTCDDVGTTITATVFASDASGNIASCTSQITVVDELGPVITCPADQTVDPGPGNLFYEVPDYFATGEATAEDNCTDPVTITSQDPAAGSLIPDGTYTVTLTAEDEYGNVSTCEFELTVESVLGLDDNALDSAIALYPNPASSVVTLANTSGTLLDKAAIYDTNGRLVRTIGLGDMQQEKAIDVSALASGVYMVQITSGNASTVKRLVKE